VLGTKFHFALASEMTSARNVVGKRLQSRPQPEVVELGWPQTSGEPSYLLEGFIESAAKALSGLARIPLRAFDEPFGV
jgi:hypothetical protein